MDEPDSPTPEVKEGVIVPLQIIRGEGIKVERPPEEPLEIRSPNPEDMNGLVAIDNELGKMFLELGKIEAQIIEIAQKKFELYNALKAKQADMMKRVNDVAASLGITPEGTQEKWTLDFARRVFLRLR